MQGSKSQETDITATGALGNKGKDNSYKEEKKVSSRQPISNRQPQRVKLRKGLRTAIPAPRHQGYDPVVSSPLTTHKKQSSSSRNSDESGPKAKSPPITRRNLQVRVVEASPKPGLRLDLSGNAKEMANTMHSQSSFVPLLRERSIASFQSVGDYSRYPSRPRTRNSSAGPPWLVHGEWPESRRQSNLSSGFDSQDPERGFSPYLEDGGVAISFPTIDEKEDDDNLHNPDVNEKIGPNYKRAFMAVLCCLLFVSGLLTLFVVWPVLTYGGYGVFGGVGKPGAEAEWRLSDIDYPILRNVRSTLIDPDTPESAMTRNSVFGKGKLRLVFSDEFNKDGRTFYEGDDPFWQAVDLHYAATQDLEWYDPDAATTLGGTLQLRLDSFRNHDLDYRSGMVQSWNKLCFKGGVLEVSASLPGPPGTPGLWPGIWTLGNLARPGYKSTTDGVWPYSYDRCDAGISPNQSSDDGISFLPGQKLAKCVCDGEDHPSPGTGRGSPEIDALEATADGKLNLGVVTQSNQVVGLPSDSQCSTLITSISRHHLTFGTNRITTSSPLEIMK